MLHGNRISKLARTVMVTTLLGAAACAGESAEQDAAADAAADAAVEAAGGQESGAAEGMSPHGEVSVLVYECADDGTFALTIAPGVGKAALRLAGDEVFQLDQVEVASGMEFSDGTYTFRGKGPEASVEKDGEAILTDCTATGHPQ